jgi:hypothetical protein
MHHLVTKEVDEIARVLVDRIFQVQTKWIQLDAVNALLRNMFYGLVDNALNDQFNKRLKKTIHHGFDVEVALSKTNKRLTKFMDNLSFEFYGRRRQMPDIQPRWTGRLVTMRMMIYKKLAIMLHLQIMHCVLPSFVQLPKDLWNEIRSFLGKRKV